ncbi:MAG: glycerophosphodiester phosphodiesterase [Myxococcales bacterium]|nr:glycerophosphodiester phosphodiesterase [Myxococcales bacterium]
MTEPRPILNGPRPHCFAHRGGAALWPENTLPAFEGALGLGCDFIETDVHLTRDRHLVLFHDARLERTTNGYGQVREHTLSELERLDAGYWFSDDGKHRPWRGKGVRIPRLEELVALDPTLRMNVEMKQQGVGLPLALWELIERRALHDRILVAAAERALGREFRRIARGRVAQSASASEVLELWSACKLGASRLVPIAYDALQVPPVFHGLRVITRQFVRAAHARGVELHAWTIDDPTEMRALVALGVDGIMSDRPDLLCETLRPPLDNQGASSRD